MDFLQAATKKYPGTAWNLNGVYPNCVLTQAEDGTKRVPVPSLVELQKIIDTDPLRYQEQRRPLYPPWQDLADAIYWKQLGDPAPLKLYADQCTKVKNLYPKGETK